MSESTERNRIEWIGIDVSKGKLDLYELSHQRHLEFKNTEAGIEALLKQVSSHSNVAVVCEATGGYEQKMAQRLNDAGIRVSVVNPRPVRDLARALSKLAKTDPIDAYVIAKYGEVAEPAATVFASKIAKELKGWVTRRQQLVEIISSEKNRRTLLCEGLIRDALDKHIAWLTAEVKEIDQVIRTLSESTHEWREKKKILRSPKGIGPLISASFLVLIPELGTLNRKQVAALAGLAPYNRDSGQFRGHRKIWGGRSAVRSLLYMATLSALRANPPIRRFYQHLLEKGKAKKVAIIACMRKFLICLNSMVKNNEEWDDYKVTALLQKP